MIDAITLFTLLFWLTLAVTVLAMLRRGLLSTFLAAVCWFVLALTTLIEGDQSSVLTVGLSLLFGGLGVVFTVLSVVDAANMFHEKRYGTGW